MKIILIGASGYLGQALIPFLRDAGHEITVISRHAPKLDAKFVGGTAKIWAIGRANLTAPMP